MNYITSMDKQTGEEIKLSYVDYGNGTPVILIHGWPLDKRMWEYQVTDLVKSGCRVIKYDRRGFGKSDKPWDGYDYDTLADDLNAVIEELQLQDIVLVGFSMGGGEVVRYITRHGSDRISKIVLISTVLPFLVKTDSNPDGVDKSVFDEMNKQMKDDRINFLDDFGKKFFGVNVISKPVSKPLLSYYRMIGSNASPIATEKCAESFSQTDFRQDIKNIDIPTLIIHGSADKTVPIENSSDRTAKMLRDATYKVYDGAPHGLFYTDKDELNRDLVSFIHNKPFVDSSAPVAGDQMIR